MPFVVLSATTAMKLHINYITCCKSK